MKKKYSHFSLEEKVGALHRIRMNRDRGFSLKDSLSMEGISAGSFYLWSENEEVKSALSTFAEPTAISPSERVPVFRNGKSRHSVLYDFILKDEPFALHREERAFDSPHRIGNRELCNLSQMGSLPMSMLVYSLSVGVAFHGDVPDGVGADLLAGTKIGIICQDEIIFQQYLLMAKDIPEDFFVSLDSMEKMNLISEGRACCFCEKMNTPLWIEPGMRFRATVQFDKKAYQKLTNLAESGMRMTMCIELSGEMGYGDSQHLTCLV